MSLKITHSEVDSVSVVELDGRIVLGEESNSLREKLKSMVELIGSVGNNFGGRGFRSRHTTICANVGLLEG